MSFRALHAKFLPPDQMGGALLGVELALWLATEDGSDPVESPGMHYLRSLQHELAAGVQEVRQGELGVSFRALVEAVNHRSSADASPVSEVQSLEVGALVALAEMDFIDDAAAECIQHVLDGASHYNQS